MGIFAQQNFMKPFPRKYAFLLLLDTPFLGGYDMRRPQNPSTTEKKGEIFPD